MNVLKPISLAVALTLGVPLAASAAPQAARVQPLDAVTAQLPPTLAGHVQTLLGHAGDYKDEAVANRRELAQCHRRHSSAVDPADAAERTGCALGAVATEMEAAREFKQGVEGFSANLESAVAEYAQRIDEAEAILREVDAKDSASQRERAAVLQRAQRIRRSLEQRMQGEAPIDLTPEQRMEMHKVAAELESAQRRLAILEGTRSHQQDHVANIRKGVRILEELRASADLVAYRLGLRVADLDLMRWSVQVSAKGDGAVLEFERFAAAGARVMDAMEQTFEAAGGLGEFIQALPTEGPVQIPNMRTQLQDDRSLIDFFLNLDQAAG